MYLLYKKTIKWRIINKIKRFDSGFISDATETDLFGISFRLTFGNLSTMISYTAQFTIVVI
jgi:hypothetical protein